MIHHHRLTPTERQRFQRLDNARATLAVAGLINKQRSEEIARRIKEQVQELVRQRTEVILKL